MMKIGIITIHKSEVNYGACLQSFALWKYISGLGYNCEIINLLRPCHSGYRVSPSFHEQKKPILQNIKDRLSFFLQRNRTTNCLEEKKVKFEAFNRLPKYSREFCSVEDLYSAKLDYDTYITGSDQVWNPRMPFINDPYFLTFTPNKARRIAYASSFGIDYIPEDYINNYSLWLSKYSFLSTREESGAKIVEKLTGKKPLVVLDPVFLLSADDWKKFMNSVEAIVPGKYVFAYMLKYDETVIEYASSQAKAKGLNLYYVLSEDRIYDQKNSKQLSSIGPAEWLWLMDNANSIVTNSFHGSAFGIIFNKTTQILLKNGVATNNRITDLINAIDPFKHTISWDDSSQTNYTILQSNGDLSGIYKKCLEDSYSFLNKALAV